MNSNNGIALIQVLLISAILSVIALYISQTAKKQVGWAIQQKEYLDAQFELHSAESLMVYTLLTQNRERRIAGNIESKWNFFNQTFAINEKVMGKIQDYSGLIDISSGPSDKFGKLLVAQGLSHADAQVIMQSLADWVDNDELTRLNGAEANYYISQNLTMPRNGGLQSVRELMLVRGMNNVLFEKIEPMLVIYPAPHFNPMTAPLPLLSALIGAERAEQIDRERRASPINANRFSRLSGLNEMDGSFFYPGSVMKLSLEYSGEVVSLSKSSVLLVTPVLETPVSFLERRWNDF